MQTNNIHPPIFSVQGRFNRLTFLGWNCLLLIANLLIGLIFISFMPNTFNAVFENANAMGVQAFFIVLNIILFSFIFLFSIKRLHDFNATGWISLLNLVPLVNLLFIIVLVLMPGTEGNNQYGQPRETKTWESILAAIFILLFVIIIFSFSSVILRLWSL